MSKSPNSSRLGSAGSSLLKADRVAFLSTISQGAIIATLTSPFQPGATTYTMVGGDGQLAVVGSTVVRGATAPILGQTYRATIRATAADGFRSVEETFSFAALSTGTIPPAPPAITLSAPVVQTEGNSGTATFAWTVTVARNGNTDPLPYHWSVAGVGPSPADGADFGGTFPSGSGSFAAGETSKTITVLATGDTAVEPDETFALTVTLDGYGSSTSVVGTITNDDASGPLYPKLSAGFARVANKTGRAVIATVGDSVTAGLGSGVDNGSGTAAGATTLPVRAKTWPQRLGTLIAASGRKVRNDAVWGTNVLGNVNVAGYNALSTGLSVGSDWTFNQALCFGGLSFRCQTGTAATTYTPNQPADRFDVYFAIGTFSVSDSSGVLANAALTYGDLHKLTVSRATASLDPISILKTGGSDFQLIAVVPYDSTNPMLEIWNMGWSGSTTTNWNANTQGWHALRAIGTVSPSPDLWTLELGANDASGSVTAADYQTRLDALAARMVGAGGDIQIIKCHPAIYSDNRNITADYKIAMDTIVANRSLPPAIDFGAIGLVATNYNDGIHLAASGYEKEAMTIRDAIYARIQ